ncbi:PadR family transcriptional regulator [Arthrobacter sp. ok362]|uniref:PadR family transcriptional regulator n=1 Tax=Arthrobacter sp. ok362 TaxID=1761745 RepID=UPI001587FB59|nr:helix-turn-helix transcriptional regulator [Arthrobacter sp. ok362]
MEIVKESESRGSQEYGFSLASALSADGRMLTAHGTLYKALTRMTEAGLLDARWEDADIAENQGRPRRRLYSITFSGKAALISAEGIQMSKPASSVLRRART